MLEYAFGRAEENLIARLPTAFEGRNAPALQLDPGGVDRTNTPRQLLDRDTPINTLETICAASRHVFPIGQVEGRDEF